MNMKVDRPEKVSTMTSYASPINQQESSPLMQLPQEIRDEIYRYLFSSTRFCFGERAVGRLDIDTRRVVSRNSGRSLSLSRVCQRLHNEIGTQWLGQVLFHFEDPKALLDKLALVDDDVRSQIRYVRVSGKSCNVKWGYDDCFYHTAQVLKLLPLLRLQRLTVLGPKYPRLCYESLDSLVKHSDGWKELYYVSHSSEMLGFRAFFDNKRHTRLPQPVTWQKAIDERDGRAARPSVRIYRSKSPTRGSILNPNKRSVFEQQLGSEQLASDYGKTEDQSIMTPGEREKELLVIVRRGDGVDYAEEDPTSFLATGDIREDSPAQTWTEVKATSKAMSAAYRDDFDSDADSDSDSEDEGDVLVDDCEDVNEYTWPPFQFVR